MQFGVPVAELHDGGVEELAHVDAGQAQLVVHVLHLEDEHVRHALQRVRRPRREPACRHSLKAISYTSMMVLIFILIC